MMWLVVLAIGPPETDRRLREGMSMSRIVASLKKAGFAALAFAALAGTSANAATFFSFNGTTGVFGHNSIAKGAFTDTFTFSAGDGLLSSTISSIKLLVQDADFLSVTLNGVAFTPFSPDPAEAEALFALPVSNGLQTLVVSGTATGKPSYAGTLAFLAVPEPTTWAMMFTGFGSIGFAIRSRRRRTATLVSA
jgi:hypothetical protein